MLWRVRRSSADVDQGGGGAFPDVLTRGLPTPSRPGPYSGSTKFWRCTMNHKWKWLTSHPQVVDDAAPILVPPCTGETYGDHLRHIRSDPFESASGGACWHYSPIA
jgi:hypothetical protein